MKIKVSYTTEEESEIRTILELLKPVLCRFKVKKSEGKTPYKHLYFIPKNGAKPRQ